MANSSSFPLRKRAATLNISYSTAHTQMFSLFFFRFNHLYLYTHMHIRRIACFFTLMFLPLPLCFTWAADPGLIFFLYILRSTFPSDRERKKMYVRVRWISIPEKWPAALTIERKKKLTFILLHVLGNVPSRWRQGVVAITHTHTQKKTTQSPLSIYGSKRPLFFFSSFRCVAPHHRSMKCQISRIMRRAGIFCVAWVYAPTEASRGYFSRRPAASIEQICRPVMPVRWLSYSPLFCHISRRPHLGLLLISSCIRSGCF